MNAYYNPLPTDNETLKKLKAHHETSHTREATWDKPRIPFPWETCMADGCVAGREIERLLQDHK